MQLFTVRARAARPGFSLTEENASAVAHVCVALDGLPLALELAAARTRILSPSALVERVERPLALLEGGARDAPNRHRTLRATIDWSYELLDDPLQRLFARLSVFNGGATLEAIDVICRPAEDLGLELVDGLAHLVESSLLKTEERDDELRFAMFETLREYTREQLATSGDAGEIQRRHAEFFLGDPALSEVYLPNDEARGLISRLEADLGNVRAALEWAHEVGAPLELALAVLYQRSPRVFAAEAVHVLERALEKDDGGNPRLRARALAATGGLARMQGDLDTADLRFEESVRLLREVGDTTGALAQVLLRLSFISSDRDQLVEAARIARESEAVGRISDDAALHRGFALLTLGDIALAQGELDEARSLFAEASALGSPDEYGWDIDFAWLAILEGQAEEAVALAGGALRKHALDEPDQRFVWMMVNTLAAALHAAGESEPAIRLLVVSERWHGERGEVWLLEAQPRLRERVFGELERLARTPEFAVAAREGRELDLDAAIALGLAAAKRVGERT